MIDATSDHVSSTDDAHTITLSAPAMLSHAAAIELDFTHAYATNPGLTAGVIITKTAGALGGAMLWAVPFAVLGSTLHTTLAEDPRGIQALIAAWALSFAAIVAWFNWVRWKRRRPHPRELPVRDVCWDVLVQVLGRCAIVLPEDTALTLATQRIDHEGWAWRLTVPGVPGGGPAAVIRAEGDGATRIVCHRTTAAGQVSAWTAERASEDAPWTVEGVVVHDAPAWLADRACAELASSSGAARATPPVRLVEPTRAPSDAATSATRTDGAWMTRHRMSARVSSAPSMPRGEAPGASKAFGVVAQLGAAVACVGVALVPGVVDALGRALDLSAMEVFAVRAVALLVVPSVLLWMDWEDGEHLMRRRTMRVVRASDAGVRLTLRDGVLALGDDAICLERPFWVDMTRDPTAPDARPVVTVALGQGAGAKAVRVVFACEVGASAYVEALPEQVSSARWLTGDALAEVWPVLVEYALSHGERVPVLEVCDEAS